jgi:hypothetical protein
MVSSFCDLQAGVRIPWTVVGAGPFKDFQAPLPRRIFACPRAPWTTVGAGPLQELEMPLPRRIFTCPRVPWTAVGAGPSQKFQVTALRRERACPRAPWTAVGTGPSQKFHVPSSGRIRAGRLIPRTSVCARPLQRFQASFHRYFPRQHCCEPYSSSHSPSQQLWALAHEGPCACIIILFPVTADAREYCAIRLEIAQGVAYAFCVYALQRHWLLDSQRPSESKKTCV